MVTSDLAAGDEAQEPALNPYMGTGDQESWDQSLRAHPLPEAEAGELAMVVDWPAQGIDQEEVDVAVSVEDLDEATDRVVTLWE